MFMEVLKRTLLTTIKLPTIFQRLFTIFKNGLVFNSFEIVVSKSMTTLSEVSFYNSSTVHNN